MNDKEAQRLRDLLELHERRLHGLEKQHALHGFQTPPQTIIEIEDLQEKIAGIERRLRLHTIIQHSEGNNASEIPRKTRFERYEYAIRWEDTRSALLRIAVYLSLAMLIYQFKDSENISKIPDSGIYIGFMFIGVTVGVIYSLWQIYDIWRD